MLHSNDGPRLSVSPQSDHQAGRRQGADILPKYHGRTKSRPLSDAQRNLLASKLPMRAFSDWHDPRPKHLEIGFGSGAILLEHARQNPQTVCMGIEVFLTGLSGVLAALETHALDNVYLFHGMAEQVVQGMPDQAFKTIAILHPDPWPKRRHHKRRLIQAPFIDLLRKKLTDDGALTIVTDHPDYYLWIKDMMVRPDFICIEDTWADFDTVYARKATHPPRQLRYMLR